MEQDSRIRVDRREAFPARPVKSIFSWRSFVCRVLPALALMLFPLKSYADCAYDFVSPEVARAYFRAYPYTMALFGRSDGQFSYLFRADSVYMEGEEMMVSGPLVLKWEENSYGQRTYHLPGSGEMYSGVLCGNYYYGYYEPLRAAMPLEELFCVRGGIYNPGAAIRAFPEPEVFPGVEKSYSSWLDQLPEALRAYGLWWYQYAAVGPPLMHELIDSVCSVPEGGRKLPPEVYTDEDHCPGEGCTYGEWTSRYDLTVFKEPRSPEKVGKLSAGESFTAITGNVYTEPLEVIVAEPLTVYDEAGSLTLEPGRRYFVLSYIGEGHSKIWVNGRILISSGSPDNPSQEWWVKIRSRKGLKGWIWYTGDTEISGADFLE